MSPQSQARQSMLKRARAHMPENLATWVVDHLWHGFPHREPAVLEAALEALTRRWRFAHQDGLNLARKPAQGAPFGLYRTRRRRQEPRPYRTVLQSLDPLAGQCDCKDFLRNSLGLCKHLLVILDHLTRNGLPLQTGLGGDILALEEEGLQLHWHPYRALTGDGDLLAQLFLTGEADPNKSSHRAIDLFQVAEDGFIRLKQLHRQNAAKRLALVETLMPLVRLRQQGEHPLPDPAARQLLSDERDRLRLQLSNASAARDLEKRLRSLKRKLYPYQVDGVRRLLQRGRLLLADDMGLGKTAQAIACSHLLWHGRKIRRGLLIVPTSLKRQWLREWQLFSDAPLILVEGSAEQRREVFESTRSGFLVVHYEQVLRDLEIMQAWKPGLVVLDEAQRIKNWATKTSLYVKRLQPRYRLVLTGTPMENRLQELASLMDWVDDFALEPKWRLSPFHQVGGYVRHLETLRARLAPSMLRRRRQEVLKQLPPRTDTVIPVSLSDAQAEEHDALLAPIAALVQSTKRRTLSQSEFMRLMSLLTTQRIIANGMAPFRFTEIWPQLQKVEDPSEDMLRSLNSPKLLQLREMIEQLVLGQNRKVVVFSSWRRMLILAEWAVRSRLAESGFHALFFTGRESPSRRAQNLEAFHRDPNAKLLFATDSGGVGLNLQKASQCCIHLDLPWNPAVLEQRVARLHRLGQKQPIEVYQFISQDSIESRIAELVARKKALFQALFDGDRDQVAVEGHQGFVKQVSRLLQLDQRPAVAADSPDLTPERTIEATVQLADEAGDALHPGESDRQPQAPGAAEIRALFQKVEVQREADGRLHLHTDAETARTMTGLFRGLAALLESGFSNKAIQPAQPASKSKEAEEDRSSD
ncbi:MAG: ATP-dependent helicase [Planctomycetota bacterium]|nr:MAG: ATP-dependent helicase [Planctomycetota bacterium]